MTYDAIVLGVGGVGSAAMFHLARRGLRVLGIDRFPPGHDRGSSHGRTRIIRQAYFEHPDYVPLVLRAYALWRELEARTGTKLLEQTGLVEVGRTDGPIIRGIMESARRHQLAVEELSPRDVESRWPGFRVPDGSAAVFEAQAGYLRVEECVRAHVDAAQSLRAELRLAEAVRSFAVRDDAVEVRTERGVLQAGRLVVTAGAWATQLLADLGVHFQVRRKPQFCFATDDAHYEQSAGCPCFFYETADGVFYGFPKYDEWGVKVAEHSGGDPVADPLHVDRSVRRDDEARARAFLSQCLPGVAGPRTHHAVCLYTMSPDEHFIVDRHPQHPPVAVCAGLSGHGFKFTSVLGEVMADLAIDGATEQPAGFLSLSRPGLTGW